MDTPQDFHIVSPSGKVSAVNTQEEVDRWIKEGFTLASKQEVEDYILSKRRTIIQMQKEVEQKELPSDVYMATVTVGGKDGYGIASKYILEELKNLELGISTFQKNQKVGFLFHSPQSLVKMENPFKIIYTMFESDKIPDEWVDYLKEADKVLVPSHWCMEVFAKAGINADVVPLGYNDRAYRYVQRENKREAKKDFKFLHYNAFNARKGFLELWKAFNKAFDPMEPVKLVLKTNVDRWDQRFPFITPMRNPNVEVIDKPMEDKELGQLLSDTDCFVFPSRGEGFGLPPLEAMATGMPAIVPNAHGISEYFNKECMYEVNVASYEPAIYQRYKGMDVGNMAVSDVDHLAAQMRYVYEHQDEALEKGKMASEYVKELTFKNTAKKLKTIFDEYIAKEVVDRPLRNILPLEEMA